MKLNVMFTIAGIFLIVFGLAALFGAGAMATMGGLPASSATLMNVRFVGVEMLGLGLIAWLVRNADASKARDGVTLGFTIYFALHALTSLYGQFTEIHQRPCTGLRLPYKLCSQSASSWQANRVCRKRKLNPFDHATLTILHIGWMVSKEVTNSRQLVITL